MVMIMLQLHCLVLKITMVKKYLFDTANLLLVCLFVSVLNGMFVFALCNYQRKTFIDINFEVSHL